MQISDVHVQSSAAEMARRANSADPALQAKKEKAKASVENPSAKVSLSGKGGSAEALVKARANALPEVREELVSLAKERIQSGYYNTPEFSRELSTRLAEG
jgi:hypothetical protein